MSRTDYLRIGLALAASYIVIGLGTYSVLAQRASNIAIGQDCVLSSEGLQVDLRRVIAIDSAGDQMALVIDGIAQWVEIDIMEEDRVRIDVAWRRCTGLIEKAR
jgi:hypothetical protein